MKQPKTEVEASVELIKTGVRTIRDDLTRVNLRFDGMDLRLKNLESDTAELKSDVSELISFCNFLT